MNYRFSPKLLLTILLLVFCCSCSYFQTRPDGDSLQEGVGEPVVDTRQGAPLIDTGSPEEGGAGEDRQLPIIDGLSDVPVEESQQLEQALEAGDKDLGDENSLRLVTPPGERVMTTAELRWQIPGEAVERYYISYGISPEALLERVTVEVSDLERLDDPMHGPLFSFLLRNIPAGEKVYFTIQAENSFGKSPVSPVQEIE